MKTNVADCVLQRLRGGRASFGHAADGINGLLAAWESREPTDV